MWIKYYDQDHYVNLDKATDILKQENCKILFEFGATRSIFEYFTDKERDEAWNEIIGSLHRNE